ncbi:unnamed protein product, partial [Didymodactylos carnosus]
PAEQFTGRDDQDPIAWVQGINELFVATGVKKEDRRKLLLMYFSDDVKKWYRNSEHEEDYDAFTLELIRSFTSSTQRLNISSKLINRRQGVNESVQSYYYDILQLCKRFNHVMTESDQIIHLLRGLKPSIQHHVIIIDPKQCTDLLEQAKRVKAATTLTQ